MRTLTYKDTTFEIGDRVVADFTNSKGLEYRNGSTGTITRFVNSADEFYRYAHVTWDEDSVMYKKHGVHASPEGNFATYLRFLKHENWSSTVEEPSLDMYDDLL